MGLPNYQQPIDSPLNTLAQAELLGVDFDGTAFDTFEDAPERGIYGVDEAYRMAVEKTFDFDRDAVKRYEDMGEHQNRTPGEIVDELVPNSTPEGLQRLTNDLVVAKLGVLVGQIGKPLPDGTPWPRPVPGYAECWWAISEARQMGRHVNTAFMSAGHTLFIRRAIAMAGLEQPDILVTDETIRGLNSNLPPHKLAKPNVLPLKLAMVQWLTMHGAWETANLEDASVKERIVVVGDSQEKDGGLARNGGVDFVHVTPETAAQAWQSVATRLRLGSLAVTNGAVHA